MRLGCLKTAYAELAEISGQFRLILFSGSFPQQLGRIALLDRSDDDITFVPRAAGNEYRIIPQLPAIEALMRAEEFVAEHPDFYHFSYAKIMLHTDTIVGFEVRPLYIRSTFGVSDVLDVSYHHRGSEVSVSVCLLDIVKRQLAGN